MKPLTKKEAELWHFWVEHIKKNGFAPNFYEAAKKQNVSYQMVQQRVRAMIVKGWMVRLPTGSLKFRRRGIFPSNPKVSKSKRYLERIAKI